MSATMEHENGQESMGYYENLEPSLEYTLGRCRDYWRGKVPLMTS
jgi:hypothetical protein